MKETPRADLHKGLKLIENAVDKIDTQRNVADVEDLKWIHERLIVAAFQLKKVYDSNDLLSQSPLSDNQQVEDLDANENSNQSVWETYFNEVPSPSNEEPQIPETPERPMEPEVTSTILDTVDRIETPDPFDMDEEQQDAAFQNVEASSRLDFGASTGNSAPKVGNEFACPQTKSLDSNVRVNEHAEELDSQTEVDPNEQVNFCPDVNQNTIVAEEYRLFANQDSRILIPESEQFGNVKKRPNKRSLTEEEKLAAQTNRLLSIDLNAMDFEEDEEEELMDVEDQRPSTSRVKMNKENPINQQESDDDEAIVPHRSGGGRRNCLLSDDEDEGNSEKAEHGNQQSNSKKSSDKKESDGNDSNSEEEDEQSDDSSVEISDEDDLLSFNPMKASNTGRTANLVSKPGQKRLRFEDSDDDDLISVSSTHSYQARETKNDHNVFDFQLRNRGPVQNPNPLRPRKKVPRTEESNNQHELITIDSEDEDEDVKEISRSETQKKPKKAITTIQAEREERQRLIRLAEKQKNFNGIVLNDQAENASQAYSQMVVVPRVKEITLDLDSKSDPPEPVRVHPSLVRHLKPHQAEGIKFLYDSVIEDVRRLEFPGSGALLSHVMGLGKTFQTIAFLHTIMTHPKIMKVINKVLVFVPKNVLLNWYNEFDKWLRSNDRSMKKIQVNHINEAKNLTERLQKLRNWKNHKGPAVMIINYEMYRNIVQDYPLKFKNGEPKKLTNNQRNILKDQKEFRKLLQSPGADLVVLDEGHMLKNPKTALSETMLCIETKRRIILSGTPMQNNLKEYHTMINFIKPNYLGTLKEFEIKFHQPIEKGKTKDADDLDVSYMKRACFVLFKKLNKVLDRKDYNILVDAMPEKQEYVVSCYMTEQQLALYKYYIEEIVMKNEERPNLKIIQAHHVINRFTTHPYLMIEHQREKERKEANKVDDFVADENSDDEVHSNANHDDDIDLDQQPSSPGDWFSATGLVSEDDRDNFELSLKLMVLLEIIKKCEEIGDKLLVFSQSLPSLALIQRALRQSSQNWFNGRDVLKPSYERWEWKKDHDYMLITGSVSVENREMIQKKFNNPSNPRARLCLISTKAGSLGTNFVGANRVVLFDASWNPTIDQQALFRAYRFGQVKPVYVYRLVSIGIESNIYNRQITYVFFGNSGIYTTLFRKQSIAQRVIDEQQIKRHYTNADLEELFVVPAEKYDENENAKYAPPRDRLLAEVFRTIPHAVADCWPHDSLLQNDQSEQLSEEDRLAAWDEYERTRNTTNMRNLNPAQRAFVTTLRALSNINAVKTTSTERTWIDKLTDFGMDNSEAVSLLLLKVGFIEIGEHLPSKLKATYPELANPEELIEELVKTAKPITLDCGVDSLLACREKFRELKQKLSGVDRLNDTFKLLESRYNGLFTDPQPPQYPSNPHAQPAPNPSASTS
ncbi:SNF2-related and DNA RNA helicase domain containing protein [Aphelenchoides besseyi]|nr:SNF2-related and DNA RNA helicase domain containing protein [Aphelenchoides besseyi]